MLTKALMIAVAVLALLLAGTGAMLHKQIGRTATAKAELSQAKEALEQAAEAMKRSRATSAQAAKEKAALARRSAALRLELDAALAKNRAWADQQVPEEVQRALND